VVFGDEAMCHYSSRQDFVRPWLRLLDEIIIIIITIFLIITTALTFILLHHFRSGTTCTSVRCSTLSSLPSSSAHLLPLTSSTRSHFPHSSTRQLSPFFSSVRFDCL
jgi:hypothetical protein